jgi:hypothetical protein
MIKNVLPFFLDGGIETISSTGGGTKTWSGKSSFVEVSGTTACTLSIGDKDENGKPIKHGTMLVVTKTGATGQITVDPTSDFTGDDAFNLNTIRDAILFMYKGPSSSNVLGEWIPLTRFELDTNTIFTGGTVSGATTFSSSATFNGSVTLGNEDSDTLTINSEILLAGDPPLVTTDSASGTVAISANSVDAAGVLSFSGTWANEEQVTLTFSNAFDNPPVVLFSSNGVSAANNFFVDSVTGSAVVLETTSTMSGDVSYMVLGLA